jgi:hypothetical protein
MPARLAQHLVSRGLLAAAAVEEAQRRRASYGGGLDTSLLELKALPEAVLLTAIGEASGLRPVNLADFEPNPEMSRFVPANVAERLGAVPLSEDGGTLHIACAYPPPVKDLEEVSVLLGKRLELWVALEPRVRDWIATIYRTPLPPRHAMLLGTLDPTRAPPGPVPLERVKGRAEAQRGPVEEATLEDTLTREMVEQIARAVASEPILLEVRKKKPEPASDQVPAEKLDAKELHRKISALRAQNEQDPGGEPTRKVDLSALAQKITEPEPVAPAPAPAPAPSDRHVTVPIDLSAQAQSTAPADAPGAPLTPVSEEDSGGWTVQSPADQESPELPPLAAPPEVPEVVVFAGGEMPQDAPYDALPPPPARVDPGWSLAEARAALEQATIDRDQIIWVAMQLARRTFEFAAAFAVVRGTAAGWVAEGEGAEAFRQAPPTIPLDAPSLFRTVAMTRGSYVGPPPQDANTAQYLALFGRAPRTVFLFPVEVNDKLICLIYGDPGDRPVSHRGLSDLVLLCQDLPAAFGRLILMKKQRHGATQRAALSLDEVLPAAPAQVPEVNNSLGWSPAARGASGGPGRAAALPVPRHDEATRPPADFGPLLRRLVGPDATLRASAVAELARTPEPSARFLVQHFPGPTAWARLPVAELPEPEELGPVPAALARLGRPGAVALAPLLDADDTHVRYFALLTAGSLPFPELVGGVLRGLFDFEPDIASAARAAAGSLRRVPRFTSSMRDLRQELASSDTLRRSLAARALGVLHDREAVEGLINLTGSDDTLCAEAAAEALQEITRQGYGADQHAWTRWWAENRTRTRGEWLVQALRHPELDVRLAAIEELSRPLNDNLGYLADASPQAREAAARKWEAVLVSDLRLRRLE